MTTRNRLQKKLITEGSIYRSINRSKTFEENLSSLMLLLWKKDVLKIENNRIAIFDLDTLLVW